MITIKEVDEITNVFVSLNDDYLTEKEINRSHKFIDFLYNEKLSKWGSSRKLNEYNGFKQYIESLKAKINKRKNIPNWYIQNKT